MIDELRKRMIVISSIAVLFVFSGILAAMAIFSVRQLNNRMDFMAERISDGNGIFLPFDQENPLPAGAENYPGFFTEETPFSARFFTVWFDSDGDFAQANLSSISSVDEKTAVEYAGAVLENGSRRGWYGSFRYHIFDAQDGIGVVFVDGSMNRATTKAFVLTAAAVTLGGAALILIFIVVASRRAVRPLAQSYEKQTQFVTDANHELKTPLTLILTNIDIVEQELGHSEWLDDIRAEGKRMSELVGHLTALSRLDEGDLPVEKTVFSFTEVCQDTVSEFSALIDQKQLRLTALIQPNVSYCGEEAAIRRLVSILMDNAVKYCDPAGSVMLSLEKKRHPVLVVENTCQDVASLELDRLCDRFYRADRARTAGTGFGIGLSLAKAIAAAHHGSIRAYQAGAGRIGFQVTLK
ncbi:MAG: HAMP domain-containing histidine kinase [Oscillospiraceae bacterium]|nr:HAMP domain-containing histidine kinase [Oscillospiraceae bacterium]